jgi:hypothetical protein
MRAKLLTLVGVVAGLLVGAAPSATAASSDCVAPYAPLYAQATGSGITADVADVFPVERSIDFLALRSTTAPDTDADGRPDDVADGAPDRALVIRRGDGVVELTARNAYVVAHSGFSWWGDLDGDGREDMLLRVVPDGSATEGAQQDDHIVAVRGSLAPGTYDVDAIGTRVGPWGQVVLVGDQDGDGAEDVGLSTSPTTGEIVAGPSVLTGEHRTIATLDQIFLGLLDLHPGAGPTFVFEREATTDAVEVEISGDAPIRLRTAGFPEYLSSGRRVSGYLSGGHRIVTYRTDSRGGGAVWAWDLDDLCGTTRALQNHLVRAGEWLWSIARTTLFQQGLDVRDPAVHRYADAIYDANRGVIGPDPSRLLPGVTLALPSTGS